MKNTSATRFSWMKMRTVLGLMTVGIAASALVLFA